MRKTGETPASSSVVSFRPGNLPVQAVTGVLKRSAPESRLTHDAGFHGHRIAALAAAFGGTHLLTGSSSGEVRLWDMVSGRCVRTFSCGGPTLSDIFTTPGTNRMITAFLFGTKKVWDLESGDCLATLSDHPGDPVHCSDDHLFCKQNWNVRTFLRGKGPDSKRSEALIYDLNTGKRVRTFRIENSHISSLVVSPDGGKIAAAGDDHSVRIWDVASEDILHQSHRWLKWPVIAGFSPDNGSVVLSWTDRVEVQDITGSGACLTIAMPSPTRPYRARHVVKGYRLIENQIDLTDLDPLSHVRIIDIRTGQTLDGHTFTGSMELQSLTEDGRFCLGFRHGWIDAWDLERHELTASLSTSREYHGYAGGYNRIAPVNGRIAISREESVVRLIDPTYGRPARILPAGQPVRDLLATPDGKGLLTMLHGTVKYWDLSSGQCLSEFGIPEMELWDDLPQGAPVMAVTPDGKQLVLPSEDGVAIHGLSTGRHEGGFPLAEKMEGPFALYVTGDGKRLMAVAGHTGFLGAYDLRTGAPVAGFPLDGMNPFQAFCMGTEVLATATRTLLSLRDGQTGKLLRTCDHNHYINDILFVPSQARVLAAGLGGFHFWDREGGEPLTEKPDNVDGVVTFGGCPPLSPGETHIIVRGRYYIALWDIKTHRLLWRDDFLRGNRIRKVVTFPDGKRFATLDITGIVNVRSLETGEVLAALHILPDGFLWETPPDDHAPSGWLWTDREDLVSVIAPSEGNRGARILHEGDEEHGAYLKIYNNWRMVMARVDGGEAYGEHARLYARALDTARIAGGSGRSLAALPDGRKGDRT
ncbi:MAG: WD40 repeat domain-containing protein [Syntrophorhabdaceae bacterium]|nr:WD40 repeat domain-containing protein [Syntrophorhabdaceae bacterium]